MSEKSEVVTEQQAKDDEDCETETKMMRERSKNDDTPMMNDENRHCSITDENMDIDESEDNTGKLTTTNKLEN